MCISIYDSQNVQYISMNLGEYDERIIHIIPAIKSLFLTVFKLIMLRK